MAAAGARRAAPPARARRPARVPPLPHQLLRRLQHGRGAGAGLPRGGLRSTSASPITARPRPTPAGSAPDDLAPPGGRDRRGQRRLDGIRVLKGDRGRHPRRTGRSTTTTHVLARLDFVIASVHSRFNMSATGDDRADAGGHGQPAPHHHRASDRPPAALARSLRRRPRRGDREGRGHRRRARDQRRSAPARPRLAGAPARARGGRR